MNVMILARLLSVALVFLVVSILGCKEMDGSNENTMPSNGEVIGQPEVAPPRNENRDSIPSDSDREESSADNIESNLKNYLVILDD